MGASFRYRTKIIGGKPVRQLVGSSSRKGESTALERKKYRKRIKVWKRHWREAKASTSKPFITALKDVLTEGLEQVLPHPCTDAKVLDVGSSDGVLTKAVQRALETPERNVHMFSVDAANDMKNVHLGPRRFHRLAKAEKLPFNNGYFNAVMSAHTLIYTNTRKAVEQIKRVIKKGGGACLVLHHPESRILTHAKNQVGETDRMIRFFQTIKECYTEPSAKRIAELIEQARRELEPIKYDIQNKERCKILLERISESIEKAKDLANAGRIDGEIKYLRRLTMELRQLVDGMNNWFKSPQEIQKYFESFGFTDVNVDTVKSLTGKPPVRDIELLKKGDILGWRVRMRT